MKYRSTPSNENYWLKEISKNLEKSAVQTRNQDENLFNQINSIMYGTKSKYSSVAEAVEEMKQRAGLTAYLNKLSNKENQQTKTASVADGIPDVFQEHPQIKNTIINYIDTTHGTLSIPAILEKVSSIHKNDVVDASKWDDHKLLRFISSENLKAKANNPINYQVHDNLGVDDGQGDIDPENTDAFHHLMPNSGF